jgi:NADP-dependent alcohol dehydrogenase
MKNFTFHNTTKIIFGRDQIPEIVNEIPKDNKVMIIYGGGSVKRNGTLEKVRGSLKDHTIYEFGGVEANPHYETLMQAVALVKDKGVDFLLALGGDRLLTAPNLSQRLRATTVMPGILSKVTGALLKRLYRSAVF